MSNKSKEQEQLHDNAFNLIASKKERLNKPNKSFDDVVKNSLRAISNFASLDAYDLLLPRPLSPLLKASVMTKSFIFPNLCMFPMAQALAPLPSRPYKEVLLYDEEFAYNLSDDSDELVNINKDATMDDDYNRGEDEDIPTYFGSSSPIHEE
ncbi:hypothetical protein VNO78_30462 [Psophocarpus tetragonolobus]|uniref:Uncharacterized protein n=1 Tax=Psophocarpus tetragonolobus TaxID=3891 RepID=A0AAN9RXD3_PSOTE